VQRERGVEEQKQEQEQDMLRHWRLETQQQVLEEIVRWCAAFTRTSGSDQRAPSISLEFASALSREELRSDQAMKNMIAASSRNACEQEELPF
jgi:hypothetical protein